MGTRIFSGANFEGDGRARQKLVLGGRVGGVFRAHLELVVEASHQAMCLKEKIENASKMTFRRILLRDMGEGKTGESQNSQPEVLTKEDGIIDYAHRTWGGFLVDAGGVSKNCQQGDSLVQTLGSEGTRT